MVLQPGGFGSASDSTRTHDVAPGTPNGAACQPFVGGPASGSRPSPPLEGEQQGENLKRLPEGQHGAELGVQPLQFSRVRLVQVALQRRDVSPIVGPARAGLPAFADVATRLITVHTSEQQLSCSLRHSELQSRLDRRGHFSSFAALSQRAWNSSKRLLVDRSLINPNSPSANALPASASIGK
jgi:hypothetical protein